VVFTIILRAIQYSLLLTDTKVQKWFLVMNERHIHVPPIAAIRLFAMNYVPQI